MSDQIELGRYNVLPTVVKNLLIINGIFYLATYVMKMRGIDLYQIFGLHFFTAPDFHWWQVITYMFMHGNFGHLFFNMFSLWMFGAAVENVWGEKRFLLYYIITGVGAAAIHYLIVYLQIHDSLAVIPPADLNNFNIVGASGAVFALLLAFGMLFPNARIYVYFLLPIKAKWFVIIYGVLELMYGVTGTSDGVAHFAHLGGMIFGIILILYWRQKDKRKMWTNY